MLLPMPGLVPAHASSPVPGPVVPRLRTQLGPLPMRSIKGAPPPPHQPSQRARSAAEDNNDDKEEG